MTNWVMRSRAPLIAAVATVALLGWLAVDRAFKPPAVVVDAAQGRAEDRGIGEPGRSRPVMADQSAVQASLDAMERNGVLGRLMTQSETAGRVASEGALAGRGLLPIFHIVECSDGVCADVISWAEANGLEASEVLVTLGHGSVEEFHVELSEDVPPAAPQLVRRSEAVMSGIADIEGAVYVEWMADNRANVQGGGR